MTSADTPDPGPLERLNALDANDFVSALAGIVEHSPWVAGQVAALRPFTTLAGLHAAMVERLRHAPAADLLALLNLHPELAGQEAQAGTMTTASSTEQHRLGLLALSHGDHQRLTALNAAYRRKFGFPYIVALRLHDGLASVFDDLQQRLTRDTVTELATALGQVAEVMRGRLERLPPAHTACPLTHPPHSTKETP